jgi:serine protease Do
MKYLRRILVLVVLLASAGSALSQSKIPADAYRDGPNVKKAFRAVVAKPSEATVRVLADGKEVAFGVIVDPNGWIITKWSEIEVKRDKLSVKLKDGTVYQAEVRGYKDDENAAYDIAMLKIDAKGLPAIEWRDSKEATVGKWVASVGLGADPVAVGVISVGTRKFKQNDQPPKAANINAGYLGVSGLADVTDGAKVGGVPKGSPADKAGLKVNDIIYEAAGRKVINVETLINTIGRLKPGDKVLLKVKRDEEELDIEAILGKRDPKLFLNPQEIMGTTLSSRRGGFPSILQHDSGIRPEDCGGPLVDLDGKAVGINIARAGRTETFAIPAEEIQSLIGDLKSGKFAPKEDPLAKVDTTPKSSNFVLKKIADFKTDDGFDKDRPKMVVKRHVKSEEVKLSAGVTYIFEMVTSDPKLDPYLILEDDKGNIVAEDDDGGGFPNAKIVFRAPSDGVYRIIATTFNPGEIGGFTLTVRKQADPGKEKLKK